MKNKILKTCVLIGLSVSLLGCAASGGSRAGMVSGRTVPTEAGWIRNGEPIEFEGEKWYPADSIEILLDSEVYQVAEYKGVPLYIDLTDVRPYDRLYTRFDKNKFRFFEKKRKYDRNFRPL